jgi:hypothetical protein
MRSGISADLHPPISFLKGDGTKVIAIQEPDQLLYFFLPIGHKGYYATTAVF